jgi:protein phosphatase
VLVGAAGAGKTTLAARLPPPAEILSSDDLRAVVAGDAADQRATRTAFSILHREARRRVAAGRLVVVDATNVERHARAALLRIAALFAVPADAIVIRPADEVVRGRNAARAERVVPLDVVERHLAAVAALGLDHAAVAAGLMSEGFRSAHLIEDPDDLDVVVEVGSVADAL